MGITVARYTAHMRAWRRSARAAGSISPGAYSSPSNAPRSDSAQIIRRGPQRSPCLRLAATAPPSLKQR